MIIEYPRCGKTILMLREYEKAKENGKNVVLIDKKKFKKEKKGFNRFMKW